MARKITITNHSNARTFTMRLVQKGDRYGRDMCLTHEKDEPLVEFYDLTYKFDRDVDGEVLGQFTGARYYASTFLNGGNSSGLILDGGNRDVWSLDGAALAEGKNVLWGWLGAQ